MIGKCAHLSPKAKKWSCNSNPATEYFYILGQLVNISCIKMISISLKQNVVAKPSQVRDMLLEHEHLNRFFNATFLLIKTQDEGEISGGKGSIRQVCMLGGKFQERIISADDTHITYQIMGNKPVAEHRGDIYFHTNNNSPEPSIAPITKVTYNISCKAPWWIPNFILSFFIKKDITQALKKLAFYFKGVAK